VVSRLATKDDGLKFKIKMFQVGDWLINAY
jgi:hypothetical protein